MGLKREVYKNKTLKFVLRQGQQGITLQIYGLFPIFANKKPIKKQNEIFRL